MKMFSKLSKDLFFVVLLTLIIVLPFVPALLFHLSFLPMSMQFSDLMLFNYPFKVWYAQMISAHQFPFWTTLMGNGYPIFAEGQIGALYPFNFILFSLFEPVLGFKLEFVLHLLLAGLFTYAFCRSSLKLSYSASILAGITYAFSGFMMTHIHTINVVLVVSYLPLVMLLVEKIITTKKLIFGFLLTLAWAVVILAGHFEMAAYLIMLSGLFLIAFSFFRKPVQTQNDFIKIFLIFLMSLLLGIGICSLQVFPTLELVSLSTRAGGLKAAENNVAPWPLDTFAFFFNPKAFDLYLPYHDLNLAVNLTFVYVYIGLISLFLALLSFFTLFRKPLSLIFSVFLVISLLYGFGESIPFYPIIREVIPGFKYFRDPIKIIFFIEFCLAILAAIELEFILSFCKKKIKPVKTKRFYISSSMIVFILATGIVFTAYLDLYSNNISRIQRLTPDGNNFEAPSFAKIIKDRNKETNSRTATFGIFAVGPDFLPILNLQNEFKNFLTQNLNVAFGIPEIRQYSSLELEGNTSLNKYNMDIDLKKKSVIFSKEARKTMSLQNVGYVISALEQQGDDFSLIASFPLSQSVELMLQAPGNKETGKIKTNKIFLYEYKNPGPRLNFVTQVVKASDGEDASVQIVKDDFDPSKQVILVEDVNLKNSELTEKVEPKITNYQENNLDIEVNAPKEGFVVLSDTYYPGWKAKVDGEETQIYKANYDFRAVRVSSGKHNIHMEYEPTNWRIYIAISCLTLIFTLSGLVFSWFREYKFQLKTKNKK